MTSFHFYLILAAWGARLYELEVNSLCAFDNRNDTTAFKEDRDVIIGK